MCFPRSLGHVTRPGFRLQNPPNRLVVATSLLQHVWPLALCRKTARAKSSRTGQQPPKKPHQGVVMQRGYNSIHAATNPTPTICSQAQSRWPPSGCTQATNIWTSTFVLFCLFVVVVVDKLRTCQIELHLSASDRQHDRLPSPQQLHSSGSGTSLAAASATYNQLQQSHAWTCVYVYIYICKSLAPCPWTQLPVNIVLTLLAIF